MPNHRFSRCLGIACLAASLLTAPGLLTLDASSAADAGLSASGATCGRGYYYSGQITENYANQGIERYIDGDNMVVEDSGSQHALSWEGAFDDSDEYAQDYGFDWIQDGYGSGVVDGASLSTTEVYMEENDYYSSQAYAGAYIQPYPQFSTANDAFFNDFQTPYTRQISIDGSEVDLYEYYAYVKEPGGTATLIGGSWWADNSGVARLEANNEAMVTTTQYDDCPYWLTSSPELYGTNGSASGYDSGTELAIHNDTPDGGSWVSWNADILTQPYTVWDTCGTPTTGFTFDGTNCADGLSAYSFGSLATYGAFEGWGGDDQL